MSRVPGLSLALASLYEPPKQGSKPGRFHKVSSRTCPAGPGIIGDAMKELIVPPIVIPLVLVVALVAYALFRVLF
jgi:hypothetical protein